MSYVYGRSGAPNRPDYPNAHRATGKREKHVFSGSMVAHVWAQQTQAWGKRSDGRIYFDGDTIYSYGRHFPVARFVEHDGRKAVLFSDRKYSVSTSQHQALVRGALHGLHVPVFNVPEIPTHSDDWPRFAEKVRAHYEKERDENITKAARAKRNPEWYMRAAIDAVRAANAYAEFFGLKDRMEEPKFTPEFMEQARERAAKHAAEKAAKTRAEKEARRIQRQEEIARYKLGANGCWQIDDLITETDRIEHEKNRPAFVANAVELWRRNEIGDHSLPHESGTQTMLRVSRDGERIETSRGAEFPLEHGKRAFKFILECRERAIEHVRNGHSIHLGHFTIDRIEPNGDVRAGCHHVTWAEIESLARQVGLIP